MSQKQNILLTVAACLLVAFTMVGLLVHKMQNKPLLNEQQLLERGVFLFDQPRIIKDFNLLNQDAEPFTKQNLQGKWSLVFFGFSFCGHICPSTLALLNQMITQLDDPELLASTQVVLISVDPKRDTPQRLKEYLPNFNKDFIGVTGEFMPLQNVAYNLNSAFQKVPGSQDESGNYDIDHSGNVFLVNPYGDFQGFMKPPFTAEDMVLNYRAVRQHYDY